jgi:hypothetical protein
MDSAIRDPKDSDPHAEFNDMMEYLLEDENHSPQSKIMAKSPDADPILPHK